MAQPLVVGVLVALTAVLTGEVISSGKRDASVIAGVQLDRLKRSISLMSTSSRSSHSIHKRSTSSELVLKSLVSYCNQIQSDPDISYYLQESNRRKPLSIRDISGHEKYQSKTTSAPHFIKLLSQLEEGKIWILLEISHSGAVRVVKMSPFEQQVLNLPTELCGTFVSRVRFSIDPIACDSDTLDLQEISFGLFSESDDIYIEYIKVNVCKLLSDMKSKKGKRSKKAIKMLSFQVPEFYISPRSDDHIVLSAELVTEFKVMLSFPESSHMDIRLLLWDWNAKKLTERFVTIKNNAKSINLKYHDTNKTNNDTDMDEAQKELLVIKTKSLNRQMLTLIVVVNATLLPSNSGTISFQRSMPVRKTTSTSLLSKNVVRLKLADEPHVFPKNFIYFGSKQRFQYDTDKRYNGGFDLNCQAHGENIASIYITKMTEPHKEPIKTETIGLPYIAMTTWHLGKPSFEVEGLYQCSAIDRVGRAKTVTLSLYRKAKIVSFRLSANEATQLADAQCVVISGRNTDVSFLIGTNHENQTTMDVGDPKYNMVTRFDQSSRLTNVSISIPMNELRIPQKVLSCSVRGDDVAVKTDIQLEAHGEITKGFSPEIDEGDITAHWFKNGSFLLTCKASGSNPLKVQMVLTAPEDTGMSYQEPNNTSRERHEKLIVTRLFTYREYGMGYYDLFVLHLTCTVTNRFGRAIRQGRDIFYHLLP